MRRPTPPEGALMSSRNVKCPSGAESRRRTDTLQAALVDPQLRGGEPSTCRSTLDSC
jgi:hypothetical protein